MRRPFIFHLLITLIFFSTIVLLYGILMNTGQMKPIAFAAFNNNPPSQKTSLTDTVNIENQKNLSLRTNKTNTTPTITKNTTSGERGVVQGTSNVRTGDCDTQTTETTIVAGRAPCIVSPLKLEVIIRNSVTKNMMEGDFLSEKGRQESDIVARATSSQAGLFSLDLLAGEYSYFAVYNNKEYCINTKDSDTAACPLNIEPDRTSKIRIQIDEARNSDDTTVIQ